jgi:hypothetical protein
MRKVAPYSIVVINGTVDVERDMEEAEWQNEVCFKKKKNINSFK